MSFCERHIGPNDGEIQAMLHELNLPSYEALMRQAIPKNIQQKKSLLLPEPVDEAEIKTILNQLGEQNIPGRSFIGMGYYPSIMPAAIQRYILENPGWYTAYTPYQAEIAQGRLEMLLNFQTMITDLTAMEIANASLLDEGTAAAEALAFMYNLAKKHKNNARHCFISQHLHPQTIAVVETRAKALGIPLIIEDEERWDFSTPCFGAILSYPHTDGKVTDLSPFIQKCQGQRTYVTVVADLMALLLLTPPGEWKVDVVVGSTQRFGLPMGYGGPHAAYFATRQAFVRLLPGRLVGVSKDKFGNVAYRLTLQTREQHIRRERATSNICTAQVLPAILATAYAIYHGPKRLKAIAERIHNRTLLLYKALKSLPQLYIYHDHFFDTLRVRFLDNAGIQAQRLRQRAEQQHYFLRYFEDHSIGISLDERTTEEECYQLFRLFYKTLYADADEETMQRAFEQVKETKPSAGIPESLRRQGPYLQHPVFNRYHTEMAFMRYLKQLENKDISLVHSMIPLGSCTMKLNAAVELLALSDPKWMDLHPFMPEQYAKGYQQLIQELEQYLCSITGLAAVSFQPNSGAQGEYTGLLVIRAYLESIGQGHRDIAFIPASAHGTNPASATMAGFKVVVIKTDAQGNIDVEDLKAKLKQYGERVAVLMVTYPSTHGVFESAIKEICDLMHEHGAQVYMDGANLNAQLGWTSPAVIGADVCHLNLHKTFAIPHGGGGPGMGPIAVAAHLKPFLPRHPLQKEASYAIGAVASAPYSSASLLTISYAYIRLMGAEGLKKAAAIAVLNANYIKHRLEPYYKILYTGENGWVAHELLIDVRKLKMQIGVDVEDIAKRLMDFGFHAPTVAFPVPGTLMIEPTESENKEELDRFCDAMIQIAKEIQAIERGVFSKEDNPLKNAPHTAEELCSDTWQHCYSRTLAAFPLPFVKERKFWPPVARIDNSYGDRNLFCVCPMPSELVHQFS